MKDKRLGKGLEKNRVLLYVSDENKLVLEELLSSLDRKRFSSLGSAIFHALSQFNRMLQEEEASFLPSGANIQMERLVEDVNRALIDLDLGADELTECLKPVLIAHALLSLERSFGVYSLVGERRGFPWAECRRAFAELVEDVNLSDVKLALERLRLALWNRDKGLLEVDA